MRITNDFPTLPKFRAHLDEINLTDPGHLRPNWDTYFMARFISLFSESKLLTHQF